MPRDGSSQGGNDLDDMDTWVRRRNAQLALRQEADSVARSLWNQSIRDGDDLYAGNPSDLTAIGLAALGRTGPYLSRTSSNKSVHGSLTSRNSNPGPVRSLPGDANVPSVSELEVIGRPTTPTPSGGFFDSLNHNPVARVAGGLGGYLLGLPVGALRGGWHALEGVGHGLNFAGGLLSSRDVRAKAWNDAQTATHDSLQYGRSVRANPSRLADDALSWARAANRSLNPLATPIQDTASATFGHELGIGANGAETLINIAGLFAAPEVAAGVNAARTFAATREANVAKLMGQGLAEPTARYLSKPYKGQGDHAVIQKTQKSVLGFETPLLQRAPIPKWFMDGPLNVSRPRGLSQADFYEYHYGVDPHFYGGTLPPRLNGGKGWSGKRLGLERDSRPGRTWARIPPVWKDFYTGVASGDALSLPLQDAPEAPR